MGRGLAIFVVANQVYASATLLSAALAGLVWRAGVAALWGNTDVLAAGLNSSATQQRRQAPAPARLHVRQ